MRVFANKLFFEVELRGSPDDPPLLLIAGYGGQITDWPELLLGELTAGALRVVMYDHRDAGLSQKMDGTGDPDLVAAACLQRAGKVPAAPYLLEDMADDAQAILAALGIDRAHVLGLSMGGAIAQLLALRHPRNVASLTCLMSTCGHPDDRRLGSMFAHAKPMPVAAGGVDEIVSRGRLLARLIGSPRYPADPVLLEQRLRRSAERMHHPRGQARHLAALYAERDRSEPLRALGMPALVIHGAEDPVVPPAAGRRLAMAMPTASLVEVDGMGHDLPDALAPLVARHVLRLVKSSRHVEHDHDSVSPPDRRRRGSGPALDDVRRRESEAHAASPGQDLSAVLKASN